MTIRTILKRSNLVQLGLVLLLGICFFGLGRELREADGMLRNFYPIDALFSELQVNADDKYRLALDYVSAPSARGLKDWQNLIQAERGDVARPSTSFLAGDERSLQQIADSLDLHKEEKELLQFCLEQNELLSRLTEAAVMRARGLYPDERGGFTVEGDPQPRQALQWLSDSKLALIPGKILNAGRQLRAHRHQDFLAHMSAQGHDVWWTLGLAAGGLILQALNVAAIMFTLHKRVARPLALAGMFGSLQKIKSVLLSRIQELKAAESAAHGSRQQAIRTRNQALPSLPISRNASTLQEDFLRRISHEIRTPMNAIIGMSYLCLRTRLSPSQNKYLSQINKAGGTLLDMFNRILDFASADGGSLRPERTLFPLGYFLELLRRSVAAEASEKKLSLTLNADPGLPAYLLGDERHLEEVLRILLDNAVQYTSEGGVELSVAPVAETQGKTRLRFCVADSGPGISSENQAKLFEPFVPGDMSMTRSGSGLGLGLALAGHLVDLMGGVIDVDSAPGRGSRLSFELDFDLPPEEETRAPAIAARDKGNANADDGHGGRRALVLVVDDNEINRQIARELLEQAGLSVALAEDGRRAVEYVKRQPVDVVLMDVQMPVMDGMEATRRIREMGHTPSELPILAMTAYTDSSSRMDVRDVGMSGYLTKPVDPAALYAALEEWLPGGLAHNPMREAEQSEKNADGATPPPPLHPVINAKAGLATVGGNGKLYNELLVRFVEHYGQSAAQLRDLLEHGDYRGAARLAHTVKGVAANLGAEQITELIRQMEGRLPDVPPGEDLLQGFETAMTEALEQICLLQKHNSSSATDGDMRLAGEHRHALLGLLAELPQRMETDWGGVESALEAFMPLVEGTPYAEELSRVLAAVNDFNPADMAGHAELLCRHLSEDADEDRLLH